MSNEKINYIRYYKIFCTACCQEHDIQKRFPDETKAVNYLSKQKENQIKDTLQDD